ncbi:MAG TPA: hypothetical protein V6D22_07900 [Candidatus Obscuribacterales bacterium]
MQTPTTTTNKFRLKWWPSPQDFNEAVQTPGTTYSDSDLRSGQVELTALGLPRPQTGNFASVYRIDCIHKYWAVRCFLRDIPEQQSRYHQIETTLSELNLPFFVNFAYLYEGVRLRGDWFPILKMEWAEGPTLTEYMSANVHEPNKLRQLAEEFKQLTFGLRCHGIAHGDLQHGNIIVSPAGLRLVDYDGMYVPRLAGQPANELGHPNYQHPARKASDFNAELDNFSAWIIYSSLICLAEDPALFEQLDVGDDCLLFRQRDFIQPTRSRAFSLLERHPNEIIQKYARWIRSLLRLPLDSIPDLEVEPGDPVDLPELNVPGEVTTASIRMVPTAREWRYFALFSVVLIVICAGLAVWTNNAQTDHAALRAELATVRPTGKAGEALSYYETGDYQKAIGLYQQIGDRYKLCQCWHELGHNYLDARQYEQAYDAFGTALRYLKETEFAKEGRALELASRIKGDRETASIGLRNDIRNEIWNAGRGRAFP